MVIKISWKYYAISGIITLIIFTAGMSIGFKFGEEKIKYLEQSLTDTQVTQRDIELEFSTVDFFKDSKNCQVLFAELDSIIPVAAKLGDELEFYEQTERFKDQKYFSLKKDYTLTLVRYWSYWKRAKENCASNVSTILYFYSNKNCYECQKQAAALSALKSSNPNTFQIFAFDSNIELRTIELIKKVYSVKSEPTLIINEKPYVGFQSIDNLKAALSLS